MGLVAAELPNPTDVGTAAVGEETASGAAATSTAGQRSLGHRILGRLATLVSTLAVTAIVALAAGLTAVPVIAGGHTLTVLSGSMVPRLPVGSVVVDRPVDPDSLRIGDIVTYALGKDLITHRVVAIEHAATGPVFITKGDANRTADVEPVAASQVRGRLWYDVPYIGIARDFLISKPGLMAMGGALLLVAAVWFLVRLYRPSQSAADGKSS